MTFEEFQASRRWSDDLGSELQPDWFEHREGPCTGYIYDGDCFIEKVKIDGEQSWYLILHNQEWVRPNTPDDLKSLELELYDWCRANELFD